MSQKPESSEMQSGKILSTEESNLIAKSSYETWLKSQYGQDPSQLSISHQDSSNAVSGFKQINKKLKDRVTELEGSNQRMNRNLWKLLDRKKLLKSSISKYQAKLKNSKSNNRRLLRRANLLSTKISLLEEKLEGFIKKENRISEQMSSQPGEGHEREGQKAGSGTSKNHQKEEVDFLRRVLYNLNEVRQQHPLEYAQSYDQLIDEVEKTSKSIIDYVIKLKVQSDKNHSKTKAEKKSQSQESKIQSSFQFLSFFVLSFGLGYFLGGNPSLFISSEGSGAVLPKLSLLEDTWSYLGDKKVERLQIKIQDILTLPRGMADGYNQNHLAVRNDSSFVVAAVNTGLTVYKNWNQTHSGKFKKGSAGVVDLAYAENQKKYFLRLNTSLQLLDPKNGSRKFVMNVSEDTPESFPMLYSNKHQRLFISSFSSRRLSVINPLTKSKEFHFGSKKSDLISDVKFISDQQNEIILSRQKGLIQLLEVKISKKRKHLELEKLTEISVDLLKERQEIAKSIAVCSDSKFLILSIARVIKKTQHDASRMLMFEKEGSHLKLRDSLDLIQDKIPSEIYGVKFYRRYAHNNLFLGLSMKYLHIFDFNQKTGKLTELKEKRQEHRASLPRTLSETKKGYYFIGKGRELKEAQLFD